MYTPAFLCYSLGVMGWTYPPRLGNYNKPIISSCSGDLFSFILFTSNGRAFVLVVSSGGGSPPLLPSLPPPPGRETEKKPLGQTVPCLLIPPANRNAISQRSPGCTGQAEMPGCLGVSSPRQVVPGLHLVFICILSISRVVFCLFVLSCCEHIVLVWIFIRLFLSSILCYLMHFAGWFLKKKKSLTLSCRSLINLTDIDVSVSR